MLTSKEVKEYARNMGADLVGIGSIDRFDGCPQQNDPRFIMPEAKSIIGLGFRIHRGLLRGIEEGTYFAGYPAMGYANINDVYAPMVLRKVGNLVEDNGFEATLYQNTSVRLGCDAGEAVSPDKPRPDVFLHFRIAAVICGMGEIGYSKIFLSPEYGPRQRLAFIITDAPLEPDPLFEGELCNQCMQCVSECPANAISENESVQIEIEGKKFEWGKIDVEKCGTVFNTGAPEYSPFTSDEVKGAVQNIIDDKADMNEDIIEEYGSMSTYLKENVPYIKNTWYSYHHPGAMCGARGCIRQCMIHLEKEDKLKNKFKNTFRKRSPWKLGE